MNREIGLAILSGGVALLVFGIGAFGSDLSRLFSEVPTDKSMWLLLSGAVTTIVGLVLSLHRGAT